MKTSLLILAALLLAPLATLHAAEVSAPAGLTTDSLVNPAVTEDLTPRLSCKLPWTNRGAAQSAYQVLAASSAEKLAAGKADLWDSGEVKSTSLVLVGYAGKPLAAAQTVWWKVRVADEKSDWSEWSAPAFFTTAKPWPESWSAGWITYSDTAFSDNKLFKMMERRLKGKPPYYPEAWRVPRGDFVDRYVEDASFGINEKWPKGISKEQALDYTKDRMEEVPPAPMFRREFELPDGVKRATLHAAGLGWQEIFINGQRVGEGVNNPAPTEYRQIGLYEAFDVTDLLCKGGNAIGVHVGGGWYQQGVAWSGDFIYGRPGILLELEYELGDGTKGKVVSDGKWHASLAGPVVKDNFYGGCLYDARREMPGWSEPGFPAEGWVPVTLAALPLVPALEPAALPPVKVTEVVRDDAMKEVAPGVWQMDAKYVCGYVRLNNIDAPSGTEITITYADSRQPDGRISKKNDSGTGTAGVHKMDRYICKGTGRESFEPKFVFRGFRYAEISGLPPGVKPDADAVNLRTGVARNGEFTCSDPMFNDFQAMFTRTLENCMHGIVTDNNTRERNQWHGDCMNTREIYSWTFDMLPFWRKIVRDIETTTFKTQPINGKAFTIPRAVSANMRTGGGIPVWPMSIVHLPWTVYEYYGDIEVLRGAYPLMAELMDFSDALSPDGSLVSNHSYADHLEESAEPAELLQKRPKSRTPKKLVDNGQFYDCLQTTAKAAELLGKPDDAAKYRTIAARVKEAVIREFYDAGKKTYGSQSGDGMALAIGLYPDGDREALAASLAGHVAARDGHINAGTINSLLLTQALSETGRGDLLYEMFKKEDYPGIGFMRAMGSKTIWESWGRGVVWLPQSLEKKQTFCTVLPVSQQPLAMFGDRLFYRAAAGIYPDPEHPGFKHFFLKPDWKFNAKLDNAKATYESPYGRIESDWKREGGKLVWNVTVPPSTTATASIPSSSAENVTESGKSLAKADGVKFTKIENGRALCELQSGTYRFESRLDKK